MTTAMYTIPATPTASRASPAFETARQGTLRIAEMSSAVPQRQSYLSVLQRASSCNVAGTALAALLGRAVCDTNRTLAGIVNKRGQNAHDARTRKPDRLAEPHCGRTAGRGVYRPAERQHGTQAAELLGVATTGTVRHREVDGRWAYRPHRRPGGVKLR